MTGAVGHFGLEALVRRRPGRLARPVRGQRLEREFPLHEPEGRHVQRDGFASGVAVSEDGAEQVSMGLAIGDYDNSGRLSIFTTNFSEEYNALYHNAGAYFSDWSFRSKTAASSLPYVGGTAFLDYDNDWPPGHHRGERTFTTSSAPRRPTAAAPALPQPRQRDVRGGGGARRHELTEPRARTRAGDDRPRRRRALISC